MVRVEGEIKKGVNPEVYRLLAPGFPCKNYGGRQLHFLRLPSTSVVVR